MLRPVKVIGVLALVGTGIHYGVTGTDQDLAEYEANRDYYTEYFDDSPVELEIDDTRRE